MEDIYLKEEAVKLEDQLETWRPVIGYEGRYEVSDLGRVRSLDYYRKGITVVMRTSRKKWYPTVSLFKDNIERSYSVHSLVAEAFLGPRPDKWEVNHKDGVKNNNALENLEYVTSQRNKIHAIEMGLKKVQRGKDASRVKLTENQVREIRRLVNGGMMQKEVAPLFGIHKSNVSAIMCGVSWSHL